jgi:hypothetical protein
VGQQRAESFALYLLRRSQNAASIPKNLRTLQGLLHSPANSERESSFQKDLLEPLCPRNSKNPTKEDPGWVVHSKDTETKDLVRRDRLGFLALAIGEMAQNDERHGLPLKDREGPDDYPTVNINPSLEDLKSLGVRECVIDQLNYERPAVLIRFTFNARDGETKKRLTSLMEHGLQIPLAPKSDRKVASRGTGLYLANLAASVVRWRLRVIDVAVKDSAQEGDEVNTHVGLETEVKIRRGHFFTLLSAVTRSH